MSRNEPPVQRGSLFDQWNRMHRRVAPKPKGAKRYGIEEEYGERGRWSVIRLPDEGVVDSFSGPGAKRRAQRLAGCLNSVTDDQLVPRR